MRFETDRLALRLENQGDLESLYEMMRDPYTMRFSPRPYPSDEVKGVIEQHIADDREHGFGLWALLLKKESVFIGQCGISIRHLDGEPLPKIGYHIDNGYWNNGYATEAAKGGLPYGFETLKLPALFIHTSVKKTPSRRVAQKIGMRQVKEFEQSIPNPHETMRHVVFRRAKGE
jgi:RimJ/RimL family protein N-acetyltransferase